MIIGGIGGFGGIGGIGGMHLDQSLCLIVELCWDDIGGLLIVGTEIELWEGLVEGVCSLSRLYTLKVLNFLAQVLLGFVVGITNFDCFFERLYFSLKIINFFDKL